MYFHPCLDYTLLKNIFWIQTESEREGGGRDKERSHPQHRFTAHEALPLEVGTRDLNPGPCTLQRVCLTGCTTPGPDYSLYHLFHLAQPLAQLACFLLINTFQLISHQRFHMVFPFQYVVSCRGIPVMLWSSFLYPLSPWFRFLVCLSHQDCSSSLNDFLFLTFNFFVSMK